MGSYYLTAREIRDIDARILAALIAACGITSPSDALALAGNASFTVNTDGGELSVSFAPGYRPDMSNRGKVGLAGSVMCRFTDNTLAYGVVPGVSRYSGKWNFHFGPNFTPEDMADALRAINPRNLTMRARFWYPPKVANDAGV